jgi:hypothetical protein
MKTLLALLLLPIGLAYVAFLFPFSMIILIARAAYAFSTHIGKACSEFMDWLVK